MNFYLPPRMNKQNGEKRRVGFELEFGGMSLDETAEILVKLFGGTIRKQGAYITCVDTPLGAFQIEADSNFLKKKKYEKYLQLIGLPPDQSALGHNIEELVGKLAGTLIPFEVVTPPLNIDSLQPIEEIRRELLAHSAVGTKASIFMAFGMQFNPEVPDFSATTLLAYLRSFFVLFDWLYEESDIPAARKVAPFIHDFPPEYVERILDPDYDPDQRQLITDYLDHNPTRNRPLDMLPLFSEMDSDLVFSYPVETELVKPRPTFHYRLPNSMVDDPSWTIAAEWNKWIEVERLAADPARLKQMTNDFFATRQDNMFFVRSKWAEKTRSWLHA